MSTVTWAPTDITESSGLATSRSWDDAIYTMNDENGPVFCVNPTTGAGRGRFTLKGRTLVDPESLSCDLRGQIHVWDIGDNNADRGYVSLFVLGEPGPGQHGALACTKYRLQYPGGARNAETGIVWPSGLKQIISKQATSKLYSLPSTLRAGGDYMNQLSDTGTTLGANVSDAVVSSDGHWVF